MKDHISKNGGILGGFALVTTGLIAITFYITQPRIEQAQERQLMSVLNQLVPEQMHSNELHLDCIVVDINSGSGQPSPTRIFRARQANEDIATILETTAPNGYSGAIEMLVAVSHEGKSLGARVIKHKETPGLGDKIDLRISDWILSFNDVPLTEENQSRWQVKKDGGQFDQFTGATITPRAVVEAVKNTVLYAQKNAQMIYETPSNCLPSAQQQADKQIKEDTQTPVLSKTFSRNNVIQEPSV